MTTQQQPLAEDKGPELASEPPEARERRLQQAVQALRIADGIKANPVVMVEIRQWLIEQARVAGMLLNTWGLMEGAGLVDPNRDASAREDSAYNKMKAELASSKAARGEQVSGPEPAGHEGPDVAAIGRAILDAGDTTRPRGTVTLKRRN